MISLTQRLRQAFLALLSAAAFTAPGLASAASGHAEGSGPVRTQTRPLAPFTGIALDLPAQLELRIGTAEGITIETNENLLPLIETAVERGVLQIRPVTGYASLRAPLLRIVVNARSIDSLAVRGSGAVKAAGLHAAQLKLSVAGAGSIALEQVACQSIEAAIAGDGRIALDGVAPRLSASLAGAGKLVAQRLKSQSADVAVKGSGEATVWAATELNAAIAGSGQVRYHGNPTVHAATAGSGSATRIPGAPS